VGGEVKDGGDVDVERHEDGVLGVAGGVSYIKEEETVHNVKAERGGGGMVVMVVVVVVWGMRVSRGGAGVRRCSGDSRGCRRGRWDQALGRGGLSLAK
jgi:hypothetical protein